jgi:hypothetical protein
MKSMVSIRTSINSKMNFDEFEQYVFKIKYQLLLFFYIRNRFINECEEEEK